MAIKIFLIFVYQHFCIFLIMLYPQEYFCLTFHVKVLNFPS